MPQWPGPVQAECDLIMEDIIYNLKFFDLGATPYENVDFWLRGLLSHKESDIPLEIFWDEFSPETVNIIREYVFHNFTVQAVWRHVVASLRVTITAPVKFHTCICMSHMI